METLGGNYGWNSRATGLLPARAQPAGAFITFSQLLVANGYLHFVMVKLTVVVAPLLTLPDFVCVTYPLAETVTVYCPTGM
jgi:hypothetical protein